MANTYIRYPQTGGGGGGGGGTGTVTEVDTAGLLTGGPITTSGTLTVSSIDLTSQVTGSLALSQTTGSISLTGQVSGSLPLTQTSGSISLTNQVSGGLPLSQTTGSISLTNQVVNNLPLSQTSGSISLVNQVVGNLPATNLASGSAASSSTFWRGDASWAAISVSASSIVGSVSLVNQVTGSLSTAFNGSQWTTNSGSQVYYNTRTSGSVSIGIGTNAPYYQLDFGTANGHLATGRNTSTNGIWHMGLAGTNPSWGVNQGDTSLSFTCGSSNGSGEIAFWTNNSGVDSNIRMVVGADGTVRMLKLGAGIVQSDANGNLSSGSVSLTSKVSGNLPLSQTSGSISLTNQVSGNLPTANLNSGTGATGTTFWRGDATWGTPTAASSVGKQIFSSLGSATFTFPAGTITTSLFKFTLVGGGGGGGGSSASTLSPGGNGGAAGGTAIKWLNGSANGTLSIIVGSAGPGGSAGNGGVTGSQTAISNGTMVITSVTAGGGGGGAASGTNQGKAAGGTSANGDINIDGGDASLADVVTGATSAATGGGASSMGGGGGGGGGGGNNSGNAGTAYGSGGGGGAGQNTAGGNGKQGLIIVEWTL